MEFRQLIRLVEAAERVPLAEKFSFPLPWKWTEHKSFEWAAEFRIKPVLYSVSLFQYDSTKDAWELSFTAGTRKEDFGFDRSGTGNALTVFGTLIAIAISFVKNKAPSIIKIENADNKRLAVNTRIARAIAEGTGYTISNDDDDVPSIFITASDASVHDAN